MAIKTIKKANTLSSFIISLILGVGIFTGLYLFWGYNALESGQVIETKYNNSYTNLTSAQVPLENNINALRGNLTKLESASNAWQFAINGFVSMGEIFKLPLNYINVFVGVFDSLMGTLDIVPSWVVALSLIGLLSVVIFLIWSVLKGDQGKL